MSSLAEFFTALGKYDFLQSALITAIMVGIMSGLIGSFIILRGMSLMGDAISHAVLPGVAVAYMLGVNVMIGASVFGIIAALLIGFVAANSKIKTDTSIGVVFSAFYALGFILISMAESATNLHHILFGNILAVSDSDIMTTAVVLGIVILFVVLFYKELLITSFDNTFDKTNGLNTTVSALQTVGIILVVAMLITPAATAFLWTDRLETMLVMAASVGVISSITGLYFSFTFNWASGPAIVLVAAVLFAISFVFSPKQAFFSFSKRQRTKTAATTQTAEEVIR